jgi:hypothetical protein
MVSDITARLDDYLDQCEPDWKADSVDYIWWLERCCGVPLTPPKPVTYNGQFEQDNTTRTPATQEKAA